MPCEGGFPFIVAPIRGFSLGLIPLILVFWGLFFWYLLADQRRQERRRKEGRRLREAQRRA